jgi:hypothetical protein
VFFAWTRAGSSEQGGASMRCRRARSRRVVMSKENRFPPPSGAVLHEDRADTGPRPYRDCSSSPSGFADTLRSRTVYHTRRGAHTVRAGLQ